VTDLAILQTRLASLATASTAERHALREVLLAKLGSPQLHVRAIAAEGLGRIGDERAVGDLIRALHDPAPLVRWRAAYALHALHTRALVAEARLVFEEGRSFEQWKHAVIVALIADLHSPDVQFRLDAVSSLRDIGVSTTLPALLESVVDDSEVVREAASDAVLAIVGADSESRAQVCALLAPVLHHGDPLVRCAAVTLLGRLGDRAAVSAFLPLLHDPDAGVRRNVAAALGLLGDPATSAALIARLADDDPLVRCNSAIALGRIADPYAFAPLVQIANDEQPLVREAVMEALGRIALPAAQATLLLGLHDPDPGTKVAAIQALGRLGDRQALKPLATLRRDRTVVGPRRVDREVAAARQAIAARYRKAIP